MPDNQTKIKILSREILEHNRAYSMGMPYLTDSEYDDLWRSLRDIDPANPALYHTTKSMDCKLGHLKHTRPIYGLQKAFSMDDMRIFLQRFGEESWIIQPKYDGVAAVVYPTPEKVQMVLSGDGFTGSDVTHHLPAINLTEITGSQPSINCELLIRWDNWKPEYGANPRNVVAGMINSHQIDKLGLIEAIPHNHTNLLTIKRPKDHSLDDLQDIFLEQFYLASKIFPMDGLVIKLADEKKRLAASHNGQYYHWSVAWKPPIQTAETVVTDIEWNISRNGRIIPTVVYEPVELCGTTNQRVTGNNAKWILDHGVSVGSKIVVGKAGEIIPKILKVIDPDPEKPPVPFVCPYCGEVPVWEGVHIVCKEPDVCRPQLVKRIAWFYTVHGMDLKGIGERMIEQLLTTDSTEEQIQMSKILIDHPYALLDPIQYGISNLLTEVWGLTTTDNHLNEIDNLYKRKNAAHFISGLGYKNLGYKTAYAIAQNILGAKTKDNFSDSVIENFLKGMKQFEAFTKESSFEFAPITTTKQTRYCITGELSQHRTEIIEFLSQRDWLFINHVSKNLDYLILGDLKRESGKLNRARTIGTTIISEDQLYELLKEKD